MTPTSLAIYEPTILPALHRMQAKSGYLSKEDLRQFSQQSGIPMHRLQGVASFFPHFRLTPPPTVTLHVCRDMSCHLAGSAQVLKEMATIDDPRLHVEGVSCLGRCDRAPAACLVVRQPPAASEAGKAQPETPAQREGYYLGRSPEQLKQIVEDLLAGKKTPRPDKDADQPYSSAAWEIDPYKGQPSDYAALKKAVAARRESLRRSLYFLEEQRNWSHAMAEQFRQAAERRIVDAAQDKRVAEAVRAWQTETDWAKGPELGGWADPLLSELDEAHADLRGMGGAGIPATQKWRDVREAVRDARRRRMDDRAFIVVNGDESEPGTFKDRELLLRAPHLIVEAVILAGLLTGATQGFIYIRHEYPEQIKACEQEIRRAESLGFCGSSAASLGRPFPVSVFVSPGGYICGEQSALIEAMSDNRAEPRNLPPKLETNGLLDRPTLVSNVETFAWVPYILLNGGLKYAQLGVNDCRGRRFFSVSGDVNRPGVYEVPMGLTLRELIQGENYCGGVSGGRKLKGFAPSGPSGGFLPAKLTAASGLPRKYLTSEVWLGLARRRGFDPSSTELDILDLELELNVFRALSPTQALGAGVVVYAQGRDMTDQAVNATQFFRNESCGKCVPCRLGSQKMAALGENILQGRIDESAGQVNCRRW